ncbi:MAG: class I SAM-dependent methyltransferase [Nanoarchaeota archaeon]|nr:class I SAM-dependent methyltransferase [Nanoarchaeota archaeon]
MKSKEWDKIAKNYHEEVISPFQEGVKNPLFNELNKIKNCNNKIIADVGCGRGEILNQLASKFKEVYAIDFSPEMIKIAKENCSKKNVNFFIMDMKNLDFKNKFDVILSINSLLMPKIVDVKKALNSMYSSLKDKGKFYGVFPSMNAILYQGFLILEDQIKDNDEEIALKNTKKILERSKYNFVNGTYNDNEEVQKFYYDFEIKLRLKDSGFRNLVLSKVLYPWGVNISDYEDFPGRPEMWDWFVSARV